VSSLPLDKLLQNPAIEYKMALPNLDRAELDEAMQVEGYGLAPYAQHIRQHLMRQTGPRRTWVPSVCPSVSPSASSCRARR